MLAVALDDFSVTVVDIDTRRTVRIFAGHTNTVTDMVRHLCHTALTQLCQHDNSTTFLYIVELKMFCFIKFFYMGSVLEYKQFYTVQ